LLIAVYGLVAFLVAPWAGQYAKDPLVLIFFSIVVVAIFNPVLRWLENVVERYTYRQEYDPAEVRAEISLFLRTLSDGPALASGFVQRIADRLVLANACVLYRSQYGSALLTGVSSSMAPMADRLGQEFGIV